MAETVVLLFFLVLLECFGVFLCFSAKVVCFLSVFVYSIICVCRLLPNYPELLIGGRPPPTVHTVSTKYRAVLCLTDRGFDSCIFVYF